MACSLIQSEQLVTDVLLESEASATSGAGLIGNLQSGWTEISGATAQAVFDDIDDVFAARTEAFSAAGDLLYRGASAPAILAIGTIGHVLTVNSGGTAPEWAAGGGGGGAFTADGQTQITPTTAIVLDEATGDEVALDLSHTVNKATSGATTGLLMNVTNTASPGLLDFIDFQVGATTQARISETGSLFIEEKAEADADVANYGQIWVDTATPNVLMFTNDVGTDIVISSHELLNNNTHSDTTQEGVGEGALIIGNDTPAWSLLNAGIQHDFLQMGTAQPQWNSDLTSAGDATFAGTDKTTTFAAKWKFNSVSEQISSGIITISNLYIRVQAESGTDDVLQSINNATAGATCVLVADAGDTITVEHDVGSGNIKTFDGNDWDLDGDAGDTIAFFCADGSDWFEIWRVDTTLTNPPADVTGEYHVDLFGTATQGDWTDAMQPTQFSGSPGGADVAHWQAQTDPEQDMSRSFPFGFTIPAGYSISTNSLQIRIRCYYTDNTSGAGSSTPTIDCLAYEDGIGSDLSTTTSPQTMTASIADYNFVITDTALSAGDYLVGWARARHVDGTAGDGAISRVTRISVVIA